MTKPFSIEELILRIQAILRRSGNLPMANEKRQSKKYEIQGLIFDHSNLKLTIDQTAHSLTQKEADLLKLFLDHPNEVLRREFILMRLWGDDDYFMGRSLDVFISRLRKFLQPIPKFQLKNIHSVGFCLEIGDIKTSD
jgi:DNA-binding response OmpR family regulator